jgi:hypothetical protein
MYPVPGASGLSPTRPLSYQAGQVSTLSSGYCSLSHSQMSDVGTGHNISHMSPPVAGNSPHRQHQLMNMYSNANSVMASSYTPSSGRQSLNNLLASTTIGTPPSSQGIMHCLTDRGSGSAPFQGAQVLQPPKQEQTLLYQQQHQLDPSQQQRQGHQAHAQQQAPQLWPQRPHRQHSDWHSRHSLSSSARHATQDDVYPNPIPPAPCFARSQSEHTTALDTSHNDAAKGLQCPPHAAMLINRSGPPSSGNRPASQTVKTPASGYPGVALTPAQTLVRYSGVDALTEYEQSEILNFTHIFYVGAGANKHHVRPSNRKPH